MLYANIASLPVDGERPLVSAHTKRLLAIFWVFRGRLRVVPARAADAAAAAAGAHQSIAAEAGSLGCGELTAAPSASLRAVAAGILEYRRGEVVGRGESDNGERQGSVRQSVRRAASKGGPGLTDEF